jgi:hypothetical protein
MTEPLNLPINPTNSDLADGLRATHDCLDALRADLTPVITFTLNTKKVANRTWRFGKWLAPILIAAIVGAYANLTLQNQAILASAQQSALASKTAVVVAAKSHVILADKLNSLGAAP